MELYTKYMYNGMYIEEQIQFVLNEDGRRLSMISKLKKIAITIGILVLPAIINYLISKNSEKKYASKTTERIFKWKFGNIRYIVSGRGKPLLLIHGIGIGAGMHEWEKNISELSEKYKIYAIDLLGFGRSDKPAISYSPYIYIKLINDFITEVIGEKTHVAASSHGAAYTIAAYNFEPDNFEKMLLASPVGAGRSKNLPVDSDKWLQFLLELPYAGTTVYNAMASKINLRWYLDEYLYASDKNFNKSTIEKYYESAHYGGITAKYPISAYKSRFLNIDTERLFAEIDIPVHIVWGDKNVLNPPENAVIFSEINENAAFTIFKNTKALPHAENYKDFNKICKKFFD